jgi:hypothetical protein
MLVEALLVEIGDGSGSLKLFLSLDELFVCVVGLDVIPCIVLEDVVAFFQVACAKLERVDTLLVVVGRVGLRLANGLNRGWYALCGFFFTVGGRVGRRSRGSVLDCDPFAHVLHSLGQLLLGSLLLVCALRLCVLHVGHGFLVLFHNQGTQGSTVWCV